MSSRRGSGRAIRIALLATTAPILFAGTVLAQPNWGRCPDPSVPGDPLGSARWYVEASNADDDQSGASNCTLRDAIEAVMSDADSNGCTVESEGEPAFDAQRAVILPAGSYTYTLDGTQLVWTLDPKAAPSAALCGHGPVDSVIQASDVAYGAPSRTLMVDGFGTLDIYGVRIQNGNAQALNAPEGALGSDYGGGILIANPGAFASIHDSVLTTNQAGFYGGGLACIAAGRCYELDQVIVQQNLASQSGGGIYGNGDIRSSIIRNNQAAFGGGLYTFRSGGPTSPVSEGGTPPSAMRNSEIYENVANVGGGWHNSGFGFAEGVTIEGNEAQAGAGMVISGANVESLNNVTISDNLVRLPPISSPEGDPILRRAGGLLVTLGATAGLYNVTIASNEHREPGMFAPEVVGGGSFGAGLVVDSNAALTYTQSFIGGNFYTNGPSIPDDCLNDTLASLSADYNRGGVGCDIDGTGDAAADPADLQSLSRTGELTSLTPTIDRRLPDGSFISTRPLNEGSDAIDGGPPGGCAGYFLAPGMLPVDARGFPRVDGDGNKSVICDIGSFEYGSESPSLFSDGFEHLAAPCVWSSTVGATKCGT